MALKPGAVQVMPDLACVGVVKKVGDAYLSEKGVYHVLPIELDAKYGGRSAVFFYIFQPRWFGPSFDPQSLLTENKDGKLYGMYRRHVADTKRASSLQALAGDQFGEMSAAFDKIAEPTEKDVEQVVRAIITGRDVGYILQQRKDDSGDLTEQFNVQRLFPMTEEEIKYVEEQTKNPKRKTPLMVTWDEE